MVVGKIAKIAVALVTLGSAVGAGYALKNIEKDPIAKKVSLVNDWAKNNGDCKLQLVWTRQGGLIYSPEHIVWTRKIKAGSDKDYLDEIMESLGITGGKEDKAAENRAACAAESGKKLTLHRHESVGWSKTYNHEWWKEQGR